MGVDVLLTVEEAAKLLQCSTRHLEDLRRNDDPTMPHLRFYKLGRRIRYKAEDIQDYIDACSH